MDSDKYELAKKYFKLNQSIEESQQRIKNIRKEFYSSSMHTRIETSIEGTMYTRGFNQDEEVIRLVDCIADIEKHIEKNQKKKNYLNDYLHTLPLNERNYLNERYIKCLNIPLRDDVETALNAEISEIEEAIQFMYGYGPEPEKITQVKDFKTSFKNMLQSLGVE